MDVSTITGLISNVGFPIFACCALGWYCWYTSKTHAQETKDMTAAINRNTDVIMSLINKLDKV